ncbi:MAG: glycosyltransferase family 2 protein [Gammaproteobacteria bacterium]|nr:glycosyltransferase family 2 protein [Gammaproteobacteria bacterium]
MNTENSQTQEIALSVCIPLYNEEESIYHLHKALKDALEPLNINYEIIFVDDGSKDRTFEIAEQLTEQDPNLKAIKFRKNYGQTPAMAAGIDNAQGKIIITMDGDLQNDPSDIPLFLKEIDNGHDIVVGWRHKRQDKLVTRKIPSMIANRIIGKITGVPIKDNGCSLKAYRRDIIQKIPLYSEMHRFIPAMSSIAGTNIAEIKVKHHARQFGESKYGLSRIYKVLIDLLVIKTLITFANKPLYWFTLLGIVPGVLGMLFILYSVLFLLADPDMNTFMIASSGLLALSLSTFMFSLGIFGELVYKTSSRWIEKLSYLKLTRKGL